MRERQRGAPGSGNYNHRNSGAASPRTTAPSPRTTAPSPRTVPTIIERKNSFGNHKKKKADAKWYGVIFLIVVTIALFRIKELLQNVATTTNDMDYHHNKMMPFVQTPNNNNKRRNYPPISKRQQQQQQQPTNNNNNNNSNNDNNEKENPITIRKGIEEAESRTATSDVKKNDNNNNDNDNENNNNNKNFNSDREKTAAKTSSRTSDRKITKSTTKKTRASQIKNNTATVTSTTTNPHNSDTNNNNSLPQWIVDYVEWHREMRTKYPGARLFTDPSAPNVLIRMCLGLCGGLNDRLGQLPWDLYLANQTNRVLLMEWRRPKPLEDFLVPATPQLFNWSVPPGLPRFRDMKDIRANVVEMFEGYKDDRPEEDFWEEHLDKAIYRAREGEYKNERVLRHRLLGHLNEKELEKRLALLGETDMIHNTKTFGNVFRLFFKPSAGVQSQLNDVYKQLNISPHQYSAVHCRVRHPKAHREGVVVKGKFDAYPADKTGLPWMGDTREFAIETAIRAISCSQRLRDNNTTNHHPPEEENEPLYFFSDSNDLVHYVSHQLKNESFVQANRSLFANVKKRKKSVDQKALEVVAPLNIVARDVTEENAHIDRQKGRPPSAYYATFVDLMLAVNARCMTYGIGFYAVFATKISGVTCKMLYIEEKWGGTDVKRTPDTQVC